MIISSINTYFRFLLFFLLASFVFTSCQVMVDPKNDSTITAEYQVNTLVGIVETDLDTAFRASIAALDTIGYFRTGEIPGENNIMIHARKVGDQKIYVQVFEISEEQSEIRIRIGLIGNLPESQAILAKIQDFLEMSL